MMGDEHLVSLQPGTVIAGRYEVVKCLGAGSMGLVYACRHRELSGHMVAVKVLFPEVAQDKVAAARFRNEIFASYGVSHPNVVRAYEYIRDGDLLAYTMEYVGGGDLADRIGNGDALVAIPEAVRILSEMCSGIQAIHDAGIVHRDIKPENILLSKEGHVKIADFGIARTGHGPRLTEHGGVVGTIDYVSPEYLLNSQVDWRSDIYAVGILGYEMVAGESPFRGESVYETMTKRLKVDPLPPSALRRECPPELDRAILKAMERDPEIRYQSMAEMFYDLQKIQTAPVPAPQEDTAQAPPQKGKRYIGPTLHRGIRLDPSINEPTVLAGRTARPGAAPEKTGPAAGSIVAVANARQRSDTTPVSAPNASGGDQEPPRGTASGGYSPSAVFTGWEERQDTPGGALARRDKQEQEWVEEEPEPMQRMESVLHRVDLLKPGARSERIVRPASTDSKTRSRDGGERAPRSVWIDILTLVIAVVVGVGLGFVALRVIFPDLLSRYGARGSETVRFSD